MCRGCNGNKKSILSTEEDPGDMVFPDYSFSFSCLFGNIISCKVRLVLWLTRPSTKLQGV